MKKNLSFVLFSGMMFCVMACNDGSKDISAADVPPAVTSGFTTKYPGATNVEWERKDKDGVMMYEAEFDLNGEEMKAWFAADGQFKEGEEE